MSEMTPMMKQYFEIKEQYPDTILMFRLGDFYEMFFEDARIASRELELVLTGRDCGQEERAPMCGVPFHSAEPYIARLIAKGYKVAVCEQTEDPALAKGLVRRDVIRVLTPGTVIESSMLDEGKNNFLACVCLLESGFGLCFTDISTGELHVTAFPEKGGAAKVIDEIGSFSPAEIIFDAKSASVEKICDFLVRRSGATAEQLDEAYFEPSKCSGFVTAHFSSELLDSLGIMADSAAVCALGACLTYLSETQKTELETVSEIDYYGEKQFMKLDFSTRRNLELCETLRSREKKGSLLWVLDKTKTPMGKRLLAGAVERPLTSLSKMLKRQNAVAELADDTAMRRDELDALTDIRDLERLLTRVVYGTANPRELKALSATALLLPPVKYTLARASSALLREIYDDIDTLDDIAELIEGAITDEPPFSVREGGIIKRGFNAELDSLHDIVDNGKGFLASIETAEQERTGIKKLKIGYNRVFGYYIEVLNSYKELVPEEYIRKQTLSNCERYITQELKELESKVLGAQERIVSLEYELFCKIRSQTAEHFGRIRKTAGAVALLDMLCSLARVATENNYCRPDLSEDGIIEITAGRHPVVELLLGGAPFVPNDTLLDCGENRCAIITGPNMAGKSTYMRQTALIVLMAQLGSFVPASSAKIGIVDSIFTRIGASDDLAGGQSTFMVEMNEVAAILKNATPKSLIIFDEIGRGTSTFDGMSIARAVLEYSADKRKLGAKTLFATHYHELTELEGEVDGVKNYNIAVKKRGDDISFLRRIVRGSADGSYGIEVAKLAGVPSSVLSRARIVLESLEQKSGAVVQRPAVREENTSGQISFGATAAEALAEKLRAIDVNTLTPIEALGILHSLSVEAKR